MTDDALMRRALFHAARAQGCTTPNPMVGAVVVDTEGVVVGQGCHERAGLPHAEVEALDEAGERARGGTLYVTLEPCCTYGRTGPCTTRVIEAGITRVVAAVQDPNPAVAGAGFERLRAQGISVEVGLRAAEATRLNAGFFSVHERGRPLVIAKAGTSLDARIAARAGVRTQINSPLAMREVQRLRAATDAIAVGVDTVLADDPLLTCRDIARQRPYTRVVFDRRLRTPADGRLLSTAGEGPVIMVAGPGVREALPARVEALERAGAEVIAAGSLAGAFAALAAREITTILVEGGGRLHAALWCEGLVDRLHLVVAPVVLGPAGVPLFGGHDIPWSSLRVVRVEPRGDDIWIEADVHRAH